MNQPVGSVADSIAIGTQSANRHAKRGVAFTLPTQAFRLIAHFTSICILSRLLTPDDFGIAGMVVSVTAFLELFKDAGLGTAVVQAKQLSHDVVSTLFWIVLAASLTLGGLLFMSGSVLAAVYREPRVVELTYIFAIAFVANGLAVVPQAMMRRQFKFGQLAIIEIVPLLFGVTVAISLALNGYGYVTLALQPLVVSVSSAALSWCFFPVLPGRPHWNAEINEAIYFGANSSGFAFVNYFARNLDNILIGRSWGAASLGLYARAYTLLLAPINLINTPLSSVYVPVLSRLQGSPMELRAQYLSGLSLATSVTLPLSAALFVCADEIVLILLGDKWGEVIGIFRLLCISAPFQFCCNTTGWLFQSMGRTDRQFRWGIFASSFIVLAYFVGLPWGPHGVALSYSCVMIPLTFLCMWYATRDTEISTTDVLHACLPATLFATALGATLCIIKYGLITPNSWVASVAMFAVAGIGIGLSLVSQLRRSAQSTTLSSAPA